MNWSKRMFGDASTVRFDAEAALTLKRIMPRLEATLRGVRNQDVFLQRLNEHFTDAFTAFYHLYSNHYDFFYHLEQTVFLAAQAFKTRSEALKALDEKRLSNPNWFLSEKTLAAVCYVDLFAENLQGIHEQIPYFSELGLTHLHLMPLFRAPDENSDGGYAVSSFREVNPTLGTMDELAVLTGELREHGISLMLDFVFNHTSDEHEWAQRALEGDQRYQDYYFMFEDRTLPDQLELNLREIFPEQAPGSFTFRPEINRWVWTTFNNFQWDLNYSNPEVFTMMLGELLFLANQGAEVLRLDAVPFIWKQMGTSSENLPQVHTIIRGFNAFTQMAAPAVLFNSEAIVHPSHVRSYIDAQECQLSYNPILMSSIWEALATRSTDFLRHTMNKQFPLPPGCAWLNYLRSHDDIGWGFADEDAVEIGINSVDHRYFLNLFYLGRFPGSFATGLPFNFNPRTQDMRICGTTASLAGLEKAEKLRDDAYRDTAIRRILMIHSVILSVGGIPLLYLGDEIGTLNDYNFRQQPDKAKDSRWVHRPLADIQKYERRKNATTLEGKLYKSLRHLIAMRKQTPAFAGNQTHFFSTGNSHVLGYVRQNSLLVVANFAEFPQEVAINTLRAAWEGIDEAVDLVSGIRLPDGQHILLEPYQFMWLVRRDGLTALQDVNTRM